MQRILQRIRLQVSKQKFLHKKIVNEFVRFNTNVRTKFVVVSKALIDKICDSFWMILIIIERKNLVVLLAQQSIHLNKVAYVKISQDKTVLKTKKNKDPAQILSIGIKIVIFTI
jgi:hypothetical protein